MKRSVVHIGVASLLFALTIFSFQTARADHLTDPEVAAKLGITVQRLHSLRIAFDLTNEQLLIVPALSLDAMLENLDHPGRQKHKDEEEFKVLRMMDEHGKIPPDGLLRALEHRKHMPEDEDLFPVAPDPSTNTPTFGDPQPFSAGIGQVGWTWLGPGNIGGRVRAILIHPANTNIMWLGGVDGGVWKTTNAAASWFPLNDFMANLAVACMAMDPTNPSVLYAGTGEGTYNADAIRGAGIFKSSDGGTTWSQLSGSASFNYVSRLAIDPNNSQILLAATRGGAYRSTNGGTNWTQVNATEMMDVDFHPTDSSQCISSGRTGNAYYSTNGGVTWFQASGISGLRVEVAYAASSPTTVYASVDNSSGQLYVSGDGGQTYTLRNTGNNYLSSQGWYANALWVDPTTTNVIVVGGLDLWRSIDGGATFTRISQWQSAPASAHADHHIIIHSPAYNGSTIRTVFFGDDGGIYRANNVGTVSQTSGWQELNNNLGITQFYGGAGNTNSGVIIGGTQDNGDLKYTIGGGTEGWTAWEGGDGGFSAADPTNSNNFYGEYVYLQIHRTLNGGSSSSDIYSGISDAGSSSGANFIAPFILDANNPNTLLAGGLSLWRSTSATAGALAWSAIKPSTGSKISAIAVAPGNSDIIWVGHNNGDVYYTTNGTALSPTWFQRDLGSPNLPNRFCERIAIAPGASSRVYAVFGGFNSDNVWMTTDSGVTWSNISANLPAAPVNSITIAPADTNTLYVGTEVGVFGSSNNGGTWSAGNEGPANVSVDELFWLGSKLVAVTHGRGMFYITPVIGGVNLNPAGNAITGGNGNGFVDPNECNTVNLLIQNSGATGASNITATLTTTTPGITIVQGTSLYSNLAGGAGGTNLTPFQITSSPAFACGSAAILNLNLKYDGGSNTLSYFLPSGGSNYNMTVSAGATIVPGTTDVGNHGDDVTTTISLPFNVTFYGQPFSTVTLDSNGELNFLNNASEYQNVCLPAGSYAVYALWDDLRTDNSGGGIFTSTSGSAPNRIFNIEWRAIYYGTTATANFEVRLYEGQPRVDIVYGALNGTGSGATAGIQKDASAFVQYECNSSVLSNGLQLTFQQNCTAGSGSCAPTINFSGTPTNGATPLTVNFANLSTGATSYNWDFGDGKSSTDTNAMNTYTNAGVYSVKLTGSGNGAFSSLTRTNYIVVTNPPPPAIISDFAASPISGVAPLTVLFTNLSTGATNYSWAFGDGNSSAATSPANIYANAGSYSVTLTAIGPGGTNVLVRTNYVVVTNPGLLVVTPATLNFGLLATGTTAQAALTLSNAGGAILTGSASNSTGPFTITSGTPFAIAPAASTNLLINFAPGTAGSYSNVTVVSTDAGSATSSLLGRAIYPPLLVPAPFDGQFAFSFETFGGFNYVIQYKDALTDPTWLGLKTNVGDGSVQSVTNAVATPDSRVYRLRVE